VVLDEAHSTGVYGSQGRGVVHALEEQGRVGVRLMTFGKAVGCSGGQS
jgi:8-amino-7-oxononanoate synthase